MKRQGVVIHHTGVARHFGMGHMSVRGEVDQAHRAKGWAGIGYHFVIDSSGRVAFGRPLNKTGSHCRGYNRSHFGIAIAGNYEEQELTVASKEAVERVIAELDEHFDGAPEIIPHCGAVGAATLCPGKNILPALSDLWTDA